METNMELSKETSLDRVRQSRALRSKNNSSHISPGHRLLLLDSPWDHCHLGPSPWQVREVQGKANCLARLGPGMLC